MNELYVQVPHRIQEYLITAKLNMTQFRIFNAVVRYTYGFHEEWRHLSFSFLSEKTKCNERQIKRELKAMLEQGILTERMHNGKRELRVNPLLGGDSLDTGKGDSSDTSNSDSIDTHIKKVIKEKDKKTYTVFPDGEHEFLYLYHQNFKKKFGKPHMRVSEEQLQRIWNFIDQLNECDMDRESFEQAVKDYFENLPENNNGNFLAFIQAARRFFI